MWHIVHDQIMYKHELLLCNPCESLDQDARYFPHGETATAESGFE